MTKDYLIGLVMIVVTTIIWGLSFLSIKITLAVLSPMSLAALRFLLASVVLSIMYYFGVKDKKFDKKDSLMIGFTGLLGITLYFYFENNAMLYISSSSASLIVAAIPIVALIADVVVYKFKVEKKHIFSVILSFIGVYFIVKNASGGGNTLKGYLLMGASVLVWVTYMVLSKSLQEKYDSISLTFYQTLAGTAFLIPFLFIDGVPFNEFTPVITLNIVFMGVLCSAVGYYLYLKSMEKLGMTITSVFLNLLPVVTVISSYFILDERLTTEQIIGGILVIISVCEINIKFKKKGTDEERIEVPKDKDKVV